MQVAKRIRKTIRRTAEGVDLRADANAAVSVNARDRGTVTTVRSRQVVNAATPSGPAGSRDVDQGKETQ